MSSPSPEQQPLLASSEDNNNNSNANPESANQEEDAEMKALMEDLNNMSNDMIDRIVPRFDHQTLV